MHICILRHVLNCNGEYSFNENGPAMDWVGHVIRANNLNKFSKQEIRGASLFMMYNNWYDSG